MTKPAIHLEVLPDDQQEVLHRLGGWTREKGFYLAGGTALALQLGHRESLDFDWFTADPMGDSMLLVKELAARFPGFVLRGTARGTVHGTLSGVLLTFLEYPYPLLQPLVALDLPCRAASLEAASLEAASLEAASLEDLAAMKLAALGQRGARKDFIDLYALGTRGFDLERMLKAFERKYGFPNTAHLLVALTYFDDAEREAMPRMHWGVDWRTVKETVRGWVRDRVG